MFYQFVSRNLITRVRSVPSSVIQFHHHNLVLHNLSPLLIRFLSTQNPNLTIDYLTNSCGLSPESALRASKIIVLNKGTTQPDSVVSLFKSYGFTDAHISKLVSTHPRFLLASPEKTLKPKLDYFSNIGISGPNLGKLLSRDPIFLVVSLEKNIVPSINFLRNFGATDSDVAVILNRLKWPSNIQGSMGANIAILLDHGIPKSNISKLMMKSPQTLSYEPNKLSEMVLQLKKMGFTPSSKAFINGLSVLCGMKKPLWDTKLEAYRSFGFSIDEVLSMFKKHPSIMAVSVKKINLVLDFFMNTLNWTPDDFSTYPVAISYSLEKRVIPRCYVLQILLSKGLISKTRVGYALQVAEDVFLKKFVIKFHHEEPTLLEEYHIELGTQGSKTSSKEGSEIEEL